MALFNSCIASFGVPAGAIIPPHPMPSTSGYPLSIIVGTSGNTGERSAPVVASGTTLPSWMWAIDLLRYPLKLDTDHLKSHLQRRLRYRKERRAVLNLPGFSKTP